jgi:hypothetical protein
MIFNRLWDVRSEKFVQTLETKVVAVTSADVSHDGSFMVFFFGVSPLTGPFAISYYRFLEWVFFWFFTFDCLLRFFVFFCFFLFLIQKS